MFGQQLVGYVMLGVSWIGGISEIKKIAAMPEAYYVRISPNDALSPVSIVAGAHASITMPNLYRLEAMHRWFPEFVRTITPMFKHRNGAIRLDPTCPGLGIELDHEARGEYRVDPASDDATRDR